MPDLHQPHADPAHGAPDHAELHHEESDVNFGGIVGFGAGLAAVCAGVAIVVFVLFRFLETRQAHSGPVEYPLAIADENRLPPEPRLQINPREDLRDLRAKEDELLRSYGWVDKNAGVVRIPIDDAIRLTLERGLPAREAAKP